MTASDTDTLKARLRQEGFARRDALDKSWRSEAANRIAALALALPEVADAEPVGSYWPMRSEVDPRPIMTALAERGRIVALSQIIHPHLSWREWRPGDMLVHGGFGVQEPGPDAAEVFPHVLLVPLCAFDRSGGRLGYGKGHFDRAIATLSGRHPLRTVGLAFAVQEIDHVPQDPHDRRLDLIVTEREVIRPAPGGAA
jgi:5-formyltetrahydrofolate cyclo-ligase